MSVDFFRKLTTSFGMLVLGVLFGLIAFCATTEIRDLDLWLHLKMGEVITTTGQVPAQDILSATIAGKPWQDHEWLFQTVIYSVKQVFGFDGLLYMQSALVVLAFLLLMLWTYRRDRQLVILPLLFLVLQVYSTRFTVRPDVFSVLFFILFLMILTTSLHRRWSLVALGVLEVLWVNMHGYFFWGPVLVLVFFLAEALRRHVPLPVGLKGEGRLSDEAYQRMGVGFFVVSLCTMINPLGIDGAVYPLKVLLNMTGDSKIFFKFITELQPSITAASWSDLSVQGPYKAMILVSFISFVLNWRRINFGLFLVWGIVLAFSVMALRNMIYFAVVAYVVTTLNCLTIDLKLIVPLRFVSERFELLTGWLVKIVFAVFILNHTGDIAQNGYYDFAKNERKSMYLGVAQRVFPEGAADFMAKNAITGPIFNDFNTGAYLVGRLHPGVKVFIDGRTEVYGSEFFEFYRKIWDDGDGAALDAALRKYHLRAALIGTAIGRPPAKILKLFAGRKDWKLVYFDHDGLVFLRDIPENASLIKAHGIDLKQWVVPASDIYRLGSANVFPFREINRAEALNMMGYFDQAIAEADAALAVSPACQDAFRLKSLIYLDRKDFVRAYENYRLALLQSSDSVNLRRGMALALVGLGKYDLALEQADRLDEVPSDPAGAYVRAKVYEKKKQYQKAYDILVTRIFPGERGVSEIMTIGDIFAEDGVDDLAQKAYQLAVRKDTRNVEAVKKLKDMEKKRRGEK